MAAHNPVFRCCEEDDVQGLEEYIQSGGDVHAENNKRQPPLYIAVRHDSAKCLDVLLRNGVDFRRKFKNEGEHCYPIMFAVTRYDSLECLKVLLECGANPNETIKIYGCTPLQDSVFRQSWKCFEYLVEYPTIDLNKKNRNGRTALHIAAMESLGYMMKNMMKFMKKLLDCGADPTIKDKDGNIFLDLIQDKDCQEQMREYMEAISTMDIKEPSS